MFEKEVYVERRRTLLSKMRGKGASGLVIFIGNSDSPAQYMDNAYKFRQDSSWLYFWGVDEPGFSAVIDLDEGTETLYGTDYSIDDIIWMGPTSGVAERAAGAGVGRSGAPADFEAAVARAKAAGREVHFLPASRADVAAALGGLLGFPAAEAFRSGKAGCPRASLPLVKSVVEMRLVKEAREIEEIDRACDFGVAMHTIAREGIKEGVREQIVCGDMEGYALAHGWGLSFPTILTQHGEIFHCHSHENLFEKGKLVVVDAGFESNSHYASDFTRTYPVGGRFTQRQKDIYDIVAAANEAAYQMTAPGVEYRDVHFAANMVILDGLKSVGLVSGSVDDMVAEGIGGLFMPHGLGHNMGLDVHDMEDLGEDLVGYDEGQVRSSQLGLGSLRMARKLVPGNIITDEPGIYFIPDLIKLWKAEGTDKGFVNYSLLETYFDFGGIRLEDDVLVLPDGRRRLGSSRLPILSSDIENIM
ncbi:MAG: Xaa-Pro aminopeptidase [Bacteroidales bacterium]|nr:Xaa-Pro aminopeptidase [Bacteroidales bacterium]